MTKMKSLKESIENAKKIHSEFPQWKKDAFKLEARTMTKPDTKEIRKKYGNVIVQQDEYGTITKSYPDVLNLCDAYDEAQKEIERLKVFEDFIKTVGPFEIVGGDAIHRTTPSSRQVLNTNTNWLVSQDSREFSRSTMALKKLLETIGIQKELGEV